MHKALDVRGTTAVQRAPVVDNLSTSNVEFPRKNGATGPAVVAPAEGGESGYVWPLGVSAVATDQFRFDVGTPGDHAAIQQLLSSVFHGPSRDDFAAALEDPFYEPNDRIIVRRGARVLGHVQLAQRVVRYGDRELPTSVWYRLAVLPEYRGRGFGARLVVKAEAAMRADGSVLGLLTTRIPHYFRKFGWAACIRHSHAQVGARDVLAQLSARGLPIAASDDDLNIRPWRHVELPSLVRLYDAATARAFGPCRRTEAYWRWLVGRQPTEGLLVALAGPHRHGFDMHDDAIVGYALVRDDRVLEIVAAPNRSGVMERLLARACGEAIERDHHVVQVNLPPDDELWSVVEAAGGTAHRSEAYQGEVTMAKLLDPAAFLRDLLPDLQRRAAATSLRRPIELSFLVGESSLRLTVGPRSAKLVQAGPGRTRIRMSDADFTRLLLGHLDLEQATAEGRIGFTQRQGVQIAAALFPRRPLWRPPLDDLLV